MKAGSAASSASARKGECPYCLVPLIRIRSKQEKTKDIWYVKCPYNVQGDPTTCRFIRSEEEYEATQAHSQRMKALSHESKGGLKEELDEVRQILETVVCDVCKIKAQLGDIGEAKMPFVEPKQDVGTKKLQIVLDSTAVTSLIVGFVGVVVGVVVVVSLWK